MQAVEYFTMKMSCGVHSRGLFLLYLVTFGALLLLSEVGSSTYVVHPGRHVCMKEQTIETPTKRVQTYCKPVYQKYVRMCENNQLCTSFRVVYELGYREVFTMTRQPQMVYTCCPGWTQHSPNENGCRKPLCKVMCQNGGVCTKPELCNCPSGWTGNVCQIDVNECEKGSHGCHHKCVNTEGSYRCECHEGFTLDKDRRSCHICLDCIADYRVMRDSYHGLSTRLDRLEDEKQHLRKNILKMEEEYKRSISKLKEEVVASVTSSPGPAGPGGGYYGEHPSMQMDHERLTSLSEQISILEERMELCECMQGDRPRR